MSEIYAFTVISLLLVLSPGPNSVLIVKTVSANGKKDGVQNIIGLMIATFCHGALSVLGLSALILKSAELFFVVKILGAAYLCYLGLKTIFHSFAKATQYGGESDRLSRQLPTFKATRQTSLFKNVMEGFFTQLLNPKVSIFYLAAFPQFIDFESAAYVGGAFILVSIHAAIIFCWFTGLSVFLSRIKSISGNSNVGLWVQRTSGTILVLFSGLMLTQEASK